MSQNENPDASTNRRSVTNEQNGEGMPRARFLNLGFTDGF